MERKRLLLLLAGILVAAGLLLLLWQTMDNTPPAASAPTPAPTAEGTLEVHYIDVGQADSTLLLCNGASMLIDGGNVADGSLVVSYLADQGIEKLDRVVCTHAHEDHVGGLAAVLAAYEADVVYSPVTEYSSKAFGNFAAYAENQGCGLTAPTAGETFPLGDATVTLLGPVRDYDETNNTSIVLRVDFGETAFLFTGDMEREAEADLIDSGAVLWATVLKVGHHGSSTSSSYPFVREVLAPYSVISCGTGNSYGHPNEETLSRLFDAGSTVYRTDLLGTVVAVSDGKEITFTTEKVGQPAAGMYDVDSVKYVGNKNTKTFHLEGCPNLPKAENQVVFQNRQEAVSEGYTPCGNCKP